jgi:hypothetical protein
LDEEPLAPTIASGTALVSVSVIAFQTTRPKSCWNFVEWYESAGDLLASACPFSSCVSLKHIWTCPVQFSHLCYPWDPLPGAMQLNACG